MTLKISTVDQLDTRELVLARLQPRTYYWGMVIRAAEAEAGIAFLTYPEGATEAVIMNYQATVLATGKRLEIIIDPEYLAGELNPTLPNTEQDGSKLCVLTDGTYLFLGEQRQSPTAFDRSFFVSVKGEATDIDEMETRHDDKLQIADWTWRASDKSAVIIGGDND